MLPPILSTNFIKRGSKIAYPEDSGSGSPWLWTHSYNHWLGTHLLVSPWLGTRSSTNNKGVIKFHIAIHEVLEKPSRHFTFLKIAQVFSNPTPITQSSINLQQNRINFENYVRQYGIIFLASALLYIKNKRPAQQTKPNHIRNLRRKLLKALNMNNWELLKRL